MDIFKNARFYQNNLKRNFKSVYVMKGIAMILVFISHFNMLERDQIFMQFLHVLCIPTFCFICGFLMNISKYNNPIELIESRLKKYLSIFFWLLVVSLLMYDTNFMSITKNYIQGINLLNTPLWYIAFYIVYNIVFSLILYLACFIANVCTRDDTKEYVKLIIECVVVITLVGYFSYIGYKWSLVDMKPMLPFYTNYALMLLPICTMGFMTRIVYEIAISVKENENTNTAFYYGLYVLLFFILLKLTYDNTLSNGHCDVLGGFFNDIKKFYIASMAGSTLIFIIANIYEKYCSKFLLFNILRFIGVNSTYILAFHQPSLVYEQTFQEILPSLYEKFAKSEALHNLFKILWSITFSMLVKFPIEKILGKKSE